MKSAVISFPRVGKLRELKFVSEKYFRKELSEQELKETAKILRKEHWKKQVENEIDYISSNDFSFYDGMLDISVLLNAIPARYRNLKLGELDTYFAMARGYQGKNGDVKAFAMKKWFNTNYHYMVPEIEDDTEIKLTGTKPFDEYQEAKELGIETKPVMVGGFTFLKLANYNGKKNAEDFAESITKAYIEILNKCEELGVQWVQFDEPKLVTDLKQNDIQLFQKIYQPILEYKGKVKVLLQTYFGDIRDCYQQVTELNFDGIGLDFLEGKQNFALLEESAFPSNKILFAGVVNGKNVWKCDYHKVLNLLEKIKEKADNIVINTSCSLLHVPYTLQNEENMKVEVKQHFSFAYEKLAELKELSALAKMLSTHTYENIEIYLENQKIILQARCYEDETVQQRVAGLSEQDFARSVLRKERELIQKEEFQLPNLPTTTIGSFPQTIEVKKNRTSYRKGEITKEQYDKKVYAFIKDCIKKQEEIGLDVLVHGEYERNDMVEFFGENLAGYVFTEKAWVQSYGTRCVKPPIIFSDIKREKPMSIEYAKYAQSLTDKMVKGMLTGPVTILNWSFPREDVSLKEMAYQIAFAIREEVMDLEAAGIRMIQIDEAALKEKLPIRHEDWYDCYLDWAIKAFRLCHSGVKAQTQIHTHMCYSEFDEIVKEIDDMDADVITFEASRSKLTILDALKECGFETEVGPGVYDIHSPRVPSVDEIVETLHVMLSKINPEKLWVNPDCGLKTRGVTETDASLKNLVKAAKIVREELKEI